MFIGKMLKIEQRRQISITFPLPKIITISTLGISYAQTVFLFFSLNLAVYAYHILYTISYPAF